MWSTIASPRATASAALPDYGPAPDFAGIDGWLNSRPLTMQELRGKVVLIDFWTYSCINCLRTLPHVEAWYRMYRKDGLVVVGVHTPEFAFEHVPSNVRAAVKRLGVRYPVALDNEYGTWNAYGNQYWPAKYLIDRNGHIRYAHFGEGNYSVTEENIRSLLGEKLASPASDRLRDLTPTGPLTPETYLGYGRIDRFTGSKLYPDKEATYSFPPALGKDDFAYGGHWTVRVQRIVAGKDARLELRYYARKVYLVLGGHGTVQVLVDGKPHGVGAGHLGPPLHPGRRQLDRRRRARAQVLTRRLGLRLHVRLTDRVSPGSLYWSVAAGPLPPCSSRSRRKRESSAASDSPDGMSDSSISSARRSSSST